MDAVVVVGDDDSSDEDDGVVDEEMTMENLNWLTDRLVACSVDHFLNYVETLY